MKSCRSEIERLLPVVRQFARALVDGHRADIADDLVHEAVTDVLRLERAWSDGEVELRMFTRVVGANRLRLRSAVEHDRGVLPGVSARGEGASFRSMSVAAPSSGSGLDGLSLGEREALLLVVLGHLDYYRVAQVVGVPVAAVVTRLTQARDGLGTQLWASRSATRRPSLRAAGGAHLRLVKS